MRVVVVEPPVRMLQGLGWQTGSRHPVLPPVPRLRRLVEEKRLRADGGGNGGGLPVAAAIAGVGLVDDVAQSPEQYRSRQALTAHEDLGLVIPGPASL
jgi:hypothetical protein